MTAFLTVLYFLLAIKFNDGARILAVFPTPSISHQFVFRPLTQELAKRGHEVVIITTDPAFPKGNTPPNLTEIDVHDISYRKWNELYEKTSTGDADIVGQMREAFVMLAIILQKQIETPEVQKLIKEEKFDLLLLEACVRPAIVFSYIFNVPVIQVASFGFLDDNVETIGASGHLFLYPDAFAQRLYNLTKWEKVERIWKNYQLEEIMKSVEQHENVIAKKLFGPNIPTIAELKNNVHMMFLNIHSIWESNRPVPPGVIYIWGIHEQQVKELPTDLKNYLDSSKNGVIYMSLGTNVKPSLLPLEKVQMMIKVFSQLPYDVLWKWDKDELPGRSKNIKISKWFPQFDLLRHPKIKLFITQGGLQSTDEALKAGVPLIGIPMLGDQWYNVEKYVYYKIGVRLDIGSLQEEEFRNAINSVIADESYRHNIVRLREIMCDEPMKPLDRAVWWTEYVLRHGGATHLRSPGANITWAEYLELDLIIRISFILGIILIVLSVTLVKIFICIRNRISQQGKEKRT